MQSSLHICKDRAVFLSFPSVSFLTMMLSCLESSVVVMEDIKEAQEDGDDDKPKIVESSSDDDSAYPDTAIPLHHVQGAK